MSKSRGVSDMTPFEAAGYTKDTVFRVTTDVPGFRAGTQVKLERDDGTDTPLFTDGASVTFMYIYGLEYVSGPRSITMNREELTTLINEILDAREGLPSLPPDFIRWRGGDCPVSEGTQVEVILRNGDRMSESASSFDWDIDNHPRDIIAYRVLTAARAVEARELRAWFNEHAPTKFKQGDMVLYCEQLRVVAGVLPGNRLGNYYIVRDGGTDIAREEELTRYEEGE